MWVLSTKPALRPKLSLRITICLSSFNVVRKSVTLRNYVISTAELFSTCKPLPYGILLIWPHGCSCKQQKPNESSVSDSLVLICSLLSYSFIFVHASFLSCFNRALTEKDVPSSVLYSLDCFQGPQGGSCLTNSLLVHASKIMAISILHLHPYLCQPVVSGGLGILTAVGCFVTHRAAWIHSSC